MDRPVSVLPLLQTVELGDGFRVGYLERPGELEPIVLLHGIGSASSSWRHQLNGFPGHRILAWDIPGYGGSTGIEADWPVVGDYADVLARWFDALGLEAAHVVGHSLGALMGARFAAEHPGRILSLTLVSIAAGHAYLPEEQRKAKLQGRVEAVTTMTPREMAERRGPRMVGPDADESMVRAVIESMAKIKPRAYVQAARMLSRAWIHDDIARLPSAMRVQFVLADSDVITPVEQNLGVARGRPSAAVHVLGGAGHALYVEKPAELNSLLGAFLTTKKGGHP